ncbi:Bystin [Babesia duncani]|uniref:Bystin n=1 Tax=Babesia duncani TaxID=323732 RepID=A0AAD9PNU0_9APIC|nr:Bystin [Babesia duncani]
MKFKDSEKAKLKPKNGLKKKPANRNNKVHFQKAPRDDSDSEESNFEAEFLEDIPTDIARNIHKLAREYLDEPEKNLNVDDKEFLESDPLLGSNLGAVTGFLKEYKPADTSELWSKLNASAVIEHAKNESHKKMRSLFTDIGVYLSKYTSGGLPKPFKMLPKMKNWLEMLQVTKPEEWTPNAVYEATRLFVSNLTPVNVEIYLKNVLLPAVRKDINKNKKLNHHLYMALKKAMFKIIPWFKSILVPLVEEGCLYKEAAIIGSVLLKCSIPVIYAGAFIIRICQCQKWFGSTSFILLVLLQKRYNLTPQVISACVEYFCKFESFPDQLPVIWHQSLLTLVMNYKHVFTDQDKNRIKSLTSIHKHSQITPLVEQSLETEINM